MSVVNVIKNLSLVFLFAILALEGNAQMTIGLQGGGNLSTMDFTNNPDYKYTEVNYTKGFIGGLVIQFITEKHTGIQMELNYAQKGWVEIDTTFGKNLKNTNQMDYLELPILTHINMGAGNFRGLLNLGPYIGYALNRSYTITDEITGSSESHEYTFNKDLDNRIDFGLLVGFGFEYRFAFGKLATEARYAIGLGDVDKNKGSQAEVSQFRVIGVLLRYSIPLNRKSMESKTDPK